MDINAAIIDQRLNAVINNIKDNAEEQLNITDKNKLKSLAFVYLSVKTILDLSYEETFECLTEGGGDFGVDAIHISEPRDNEFVVCLFQSKYKKTLKADSHFPETGIKELINAVRYLFDPKKPLDFSNPRLQNKLTNIRSLIQQDGYIPQVRAIAINNGQKWNQATEQTISRANFGKQVKFEHFNHDQLVMLLQAAKPVSDSLQFSGKAIVEDFNFSRVLIGRIHVYEIAALMQRHGERLLERNIRRYLGLKGNRVNEEIHATLKSEERNHFYFYNNGITLVCDKFSYNGLQSDDYQVRIDNLQIINGAQTCMTIYKSLIENEEKQPTLLPPNMSNVFVLVRLYELPKEHSEELVQAITFATNSQNPVELKDLRANDEIQKRLEIDIAQLDYRYHRKRSDIALKSTDITIGIAAEAILAVWREKPHQTKFFTREHFGKLYSDIFTEYLNGAQVIIAVLLYRIAENNRKRLPENAPIFLSYASCFIAMQMGKMLLTKLKIKIEQLTHENFIEALQLIERESDELFQQALQEIEQALKKLYSDDYQKNISLPQLAATFRRGDLIELLK